METSGSLDIGKIVAGRAPHSPAKAGFLLPGEIILAPRPATLP